MTPQEKIEYEKTVYTRYYPFWVHDPKYLWPKNLVSGKKITLFGFIIGWKIRLGKANYNWNNVGE